MLAVAPNLLEDLIKKPTPSMPDTVGPTRAGQERELVHFFQESMAAASGRCAPGFLVPLTWQCPDTAAGERVELVARMTCPCLVLLMVGYLAAWWQVRCICAFASDRARCAKTHGTRSRSRADGDVTLQQDAREQRP
jgi:hypothetical protein